MSDIYIQIGLFACMRVSIALNNLDTYAFMRNIQTFIAGFNHEDPLLFHNTNTTLKLNQEETSYDTAAMMIVSQGAMSLMISKRVEYVTCVEEMPNAEDVGTIIKTCSEIIGIKSVNVDRIHPVDFSTGSSEWNLDPCDRPLSIRQISPTTLKAICHPSCMAEVDYQFIYKHSFNPTHINVVRYNTDHTTSKVLVKSVQECRSLCESNKACLSWSFDGVNTCYINTKIPFAQSLIGGVSGICKERVTCGGNDGPCNGKDTYIENTASRDESYKSKLDKRNRRALP
jgi:hypothetical protein